MTLWLLGGHDPTHGAGLYRDLVTARSVAPSLPRRFAVTALTTQGHGRPAEARAVPASRVRDRIARWPAPRAIKVGLVPDALAGCVAELVAERGVPVVVDPVLRASDGGALGTSAAGLAPLLEVATLLTPNRAEVHALLDLAVPVEAEALGQVVGRRWPGRAVLLKDGHGDDPQRVVDRLVRGERVVPFARPRTPGPDPRGTGCALATAIACALARGDALVSAVEAAIHWLDRARCDLRRGPDGQAHLPDRVRLTLEGSPTSDP